MTDHTIVSVRPRGTRDRAAAAARPRPAWLPAIAAIVIAAGVAVPFGGSVAIAQAYEAVSFSLLAGFDYELPDPLDPSSKPQPDQVPAKVKALNGRHVAIRGFMLPSDLDQDGVSLFMLNANIDMCYFGAPVRPNDWVMVRMKPGQKARFTHSGLVVSGRLEVGEEIKNGRVLSLYRMEADSAAISE